MSDSEFEAESYYESEENEEDLSSFDDESLDDDEIDIKLKKRSLNKIESKIAMKGK